MKVMGVAKALDWTGCLLHGRDGIPGTGDLFYFSRKSLSHKTRKGTVTSITRVPRPLMMEDNIYPLKTHSPLLPPCLPGNTFPHGLQIKSLNLFALTKRFSKISCPVLRQLRPNFLIPSNLLLDLILYFMFPNLPSHA